MHPAIGVLLLGLLLQSSHSFKLTILHNNDFHSRFEPTTVDSAPCDEKKSTCIAGAARTKYLAAEIKRNESNVIFLSAGDFFQGSLWYTLFKEQVVSDVVPDMGYDAVCLGNHEFDDHAEGLYQYVNNMTVRGIPVLAANLDLSAVPLLNNVTKSAVLDVSGTKIGIIGYLTPDTRFLSTPDDTITFLDEIEEIRKEAKILKDKGVKILIALGHSGYAKDQEIAEKVEDLDIVVGGHTNTFLWSKSFGPPPSKEDPLGDYPTVIRHGDRETLVVQAFAYGKYLGKLQVEFNDDGDVKSYSGRPILMDQSIQEDKDMKDKLKKYEERIEKKYSHVVGKSAVFLDGNEHSCRRRECNMGNMVSDAFIHGFLEKGSKDFDGWSRYAIAINCGGTMRTSFNPIGNDGKITLGDVIAVLPFENELVTLNITGETLKSVMEHGVSAYDPTEQRLEGRFPQVSGIRVTYDMRRVIGNQVTSLRVRCSHCQPPKYEDVEPYTYYTIITTSFLAQGGDGYSMLKSCQNKCRGEFGLKPDELVVKYLKDRGIVTAGVEDRITIIDAPASSSPTVAAFSLSLIVVSQIVTAYL